MSRTFFRLSETKDITSFNEGDIVYLIETGKLSAYAWCELKTATLYLDKSTVGTFDYQGVIKIPSKEAILAYEKGSSEITRFEITDSDRASNVSLKPIKGLKYPNNLFKNHISLGKNSPSSEKIKTCGKLHYQDLRSAKKILEIQQQNNKESATINQFLDSMKAITTKLEKAWIKPITIERSSLRFNKEEIDSLASDHKSNLPVTPSDTLFSELDNIILDIMHEEKGNSTKIWNILKLESKIGDEQRVYDKKGIILEVDNFDLTWLTENLKEKTITKKTFKNKVSLLRKHLTDSQ